MQSLMRCAWLRRSRGFWAVILLLLTSAFSWSTPAIASSHSQRSTKISKTVTQSKSNRPQVARVKRTSPNKVARGRWIEVDLSSQRLTAWENGRRVLSSRISSGKRSTPTRVGTFAIQRKYVSKTMRGQGYVTPNVPYAMFYSGGYAIHGAYWHNKFGTPVSRGCVNLPVGVAGKLYNWAGTGTRVVVRH